jgi:hypothetical protein
MTSSDRLLRRIFRAVEMHNKTSESKITLLEALNLYLEITKAGK